MSFDAFCIMSIISAILVYFINVRSHFNKVRKFYNALNGMKVNYFNFYPKEELHYFYDLVKPLSVTMWQVWVKDYNEFILDTYKLKELFIGNQRFIDNEEKRYDIKCPWCENDDIKKFSFVPYVEEKPVGLLFCLDRKSTCPPGPVENGRIYFAENDKLVIFNVQ